MIGQGFLEKNCIDGVIPGNTGGRKLAGKSLLPASHSEKQNRTDNNDKSLVLIGKFGKGDLT